MSKILRALTGAILVAGFAMTSAGTASADTFGQRNCGKKESSTQECNVWWVNSGLRVVADVVFKASDEKLVLHDHLADGKGLFVRISWGSTYDDVYNTFGADKVVRKDYNIIDGTRVYIRACQSDNGRYDINCVSTWTEA
jgi:hypothetical protein